MPRISVIMPVYNGSLFLREAIESILKQTETNFELIIIDDGSRDDSLSLCKEYQKNDKRIIIIESRENRGVIASLNEGIQRAQGEYIARMDADDVAFPNRLERQLHFLTTTGYILCGSWAEAMNAKGETLYILNYPPVSGVRFFTLKHNPFIHPTVMIKRDVALSAGLYQNGFKHVEDYEFWTRIVYKYKTGNLNEVLLRYRIHGQQITNKHRKAMLIRGLKVRFLAMFRWLSNLQAKDR